MTRFVQFQNQDEPGLYLVHPQNETAPCDVEIIFVHGLMGKPTKTWQHPETGCVFFRDLLPQQMREQLPHARARIWSYGYSADVGFQTSQIYDFALSLLQEVRDIRRGCEQRRIIWVCHSLGGIVVKRALNEACGQDQYTGIFRATVGITFLGTPHQGSGTATIGQIAAGVAGAFIPGAQILNRGLLKNLEKNSTTLFETSNRFASVCSGLQIYTFYESRPLMGTRVVVTRSSAVLNLPNETARELNANHQSICRYKDRSDQNWRPVLNSILGMVSFTLRQNPRPMPPLSGFGNQRQPQPPYPRHSQYQQHRGNLYASTGSDQIPIPQPRPSQASTPYPDRNDGIYAGMRAQWTADLPEIARRPVSSSNPSIQTAPPRPPKQPLFTGTSDSSTSTTASSLVSTSDSTILHLTLPTGVDRRETQQYPSFNTAYAREDVSPGRRTSASSRIRQPTSPIHQSPSAPSTPQEGSVENIEVAAMCDACENNMTCSQERVQCSECYDYDLCSSCFRIGRVSKSHKSSHVMRHILKTEVLKPDDFVPPHDDVNPEKSSDGSMTYITLESDVNQPGSEVRWHHLHDADSHLRYLTATAQPGHYAAHLTIIPRLSSSLGQVGKDELKKEGLGYLRIGLGTLKNKKQFFRTRYREESFQSVTLAEEDIINRSLEDYWWTVIKLPGDAQPVYVNADCVFSVENPQELGLIIQWSGIRTFASGNEAVVSINVADIRLYDIRDFTQNLRVPPSQPPTLPPTPPAQTSTPALPSQAEDDGDDYITAEDLVSALVQIQQNVEDARQRAHLQMAIKQRLQQQEEGRKNAVLGLLFAKALADQVRLEQEREEQEEARRVLRLMGFDL